jgi:cytochrome c oxidase subunit 2
VLVAALALAGCGRPAALDPAGPQAERIADLWWVFFAVLAVVYGAVLLALGASLVRRRRDEAGADPIRPNAAPARRATVAVAAASAASAAVLLVLLVASVRAGRAIARAEREAPLEIEVTGRQWWWSVRYVDGRPSDRFETANELHLPVGRAIRLSLSAADVIHSFWVPSLHGKRDLIPGRSTELFLRVDRPGTYHGVCAEFCGQQHAKMRIAVVAESQSAFDAWRERQRSAARAPRTEAERRGRDVFLASSCVLCHAIRGTSAGGRIGPDLTHLGGRARIAANVLPNTAAHRIGWVADPQATKPGARMPASPLLGAELEALAAYLGSLE